IAIELTHRFEQVFGASPSLARFLSGASLSELVAEALRQVVNPAPGLRPALVPLGATLDCYPLSEGQRGLWFLHQLAPESAAYSITRAVRMKSKIDVEALQRAFRALVQRHPALRTTFHEVNGEPVQRIHADHDIS